MHGTRALSALMCLLATLPLLSCSETRPTPVCTFTMTPAGHSIPAEGGARTVTVTASAASCTWNAGVNAPWIALPAGGSGTGSGSFDYTVAPNASTDSRAGTILIGSAAHAVTQAGRTEEPVPPEPPDPPACEYQLTPESTQTGNVGGAGTFQVNTLSSCAWTAVSNDGWVTVESGTSGIGTGTVGYRVASHAGTNERVGTITVAGRTFTVRQAGFNTSTCSYTVTPVAFSPCMAAGTLTTRVETAASCPWTVAADATWLTLSGSEVRTGPGDIVTQYTSNYAAPRDAFIRVRWPTATAGQNVRIAQAGCTYATSVSVMSIGAAGGSLTFNVFQQAVPNQCGGPLQDACVWTASVTTPWVTITTPMPRTGDNAVAFTVAPNNTTEARTATIVVQDRTVLIEQAAGTP
jgi:hypothetical protein